MNSISNQILTSILIAALIVFGGWGFIEIQNATKYETERLEKSKIRIAERLSLSLSYPVWNLNIREVYANIAKEATDENVQAINVYDESGQLYSGIIRWKGKFKNLTEKQSFESNQDLTIRRILHDKKPIGFVVIYPNKEPLQLMIKHLRLNLFIKLTILLFALASVLFVILRKVVINPLSQLKDWATLISPEKMLPPPHVFHSTEIDTLVLSFSQMTDRLISSLNEISEKNRKLEESESRIKSISNNLASGMIYQLIIQPDGTRIFTYLSKSVKTLYGITPEQGIADSSLIYDNIHPDDIEALRNAEDKAMKTLSTFKMEVRMKQLPGLYRWSSFVATPTRMEDGAVRWDGIEFDITEQKQIEEELRISQQKFSIAFNSTPDVIFVSEMGTGRIIETNEAIKNTFGYTREEAIGKTTLELGLFKNSEERQKIYQALEKNRHVRNLEVIGKHKFGLEITGLLSLEMTKINNTPCLITSVHDITERKRAEEKLRESEERYKSIISLSNTGAWEYHSDTDYLWCSPEYFTMLGRKQTNYDMSGNKNLQETWIELIHPDDREEATDHFAEYLKNGSVGTYESHFRMQHADGSWKWIWSRGQSLRDINGKVTNLTVGTHIDITERKLNEMELQKLNLDKDRFMSILGHDLRSPFNGIVGILDLLCADIRELNITEIEELLQMADKSAHNASDLLDDVLMWAMAQSGKMTFAPTDFNFKEDCTHVIEILQPVADAKNITISLDSEDNLMVYADKNMLDTILRNLISNALKFTNEGGKVIVSTEKNPDNITISVADTGVGIDPKNVTKIFDKTQLFTSAGTAEEKGTGFGLKICQEFVEKHGGKIWIESEPGKGTTFFFTLPNR